MNARERYYETTHFGQPDRVFFLPTWCWESTIARWHKEGLPEGMSPAQYFGTDTMRGVPVNSGPLGTVGGVIPLCPGFERQVISEDEEHRVVRIVDGQVVKEKTYNSMDNMPEWLDYPLKSREIWKNEFLPRLDPHTPERKLKNWDTLVAEARKRDYPLDIWTGSFWGRLQTWMGLVPLSEAYFDDPSWVHEMTEYLGWFTREVIHEALHTFDFDLAFIWEDLGMKTGPMVSPRLFREFMLPEYKKLTGFLREHGIDVIMVDSDGQSSPLIPLWLEGGVNGIRPLEVASDEDAVALRRKYGKSLIMEGNIDKRVLATTPEAIEAHVLERVPWLLTQGGFIPQVDHLTPPDVSFSNYCYFWDLIKKVAADPYRWLAEARRRGFWND
ncbi:MAG: uroporphyrinogen decarboxylase family protein [Anaerolineae bacterium]